MIGLYQKVIVKEKSSQNTLKKKSAQEILHIAITLMKMKFSNIYIGIRFNI